MGDRKDMSKDTCEENFEHGEQNQRWHARTLDKVAARFKVPESGRAELQQLASHPVQWLKGEGITDESIVTPWEKLLFALSHFFESATSGVQQRDRLWRFTYQVNPNHLTVSGAIVSVFDFFNDIMIGSIMDRHPLRDQTYRNIMRINHVVGSFIELFLLMNLGFSSFQRVAIFTVMQCFRDVLGTTAGVSGQRYFVGVAPHTQERSKIWVWQQVGMQFGWPIGNIPMWIFGLARDRYFWSDYRVITRGFWIMFPMILAQGVISTFARNRVDVHSVQFQSQLNAQKTTTYEPAKYEGLTLKQKILKFLEPYKVLKYNKFLLYQNTFDFIKIILPRGDEYPIFRRLVPTFTVFGRELRGEAIIPIRNQIAGTPITFMNPFLGRIVKRMGGPRRTMLTLAILFAVVFFVKFLVGFSTPAALIAIIGLDTIWQSLGPLKWFSGQMLDFEMLDVVEYHTGVRSEGVTTAFKGFVGKLVRNNMGALTGNYFQNWTGITSGDIGDPNFETPERFRRWAWPMYTLAPVLWFMVDIVVFLLLKHSPKDMEIIEIELKRRRELAAQAMDLLEAEESASS